MRYTFPRLALPLILVAGLTVGCGESSEQERLSNGIEHCGKYHGGAVGSEDTDNNGKVDGGNTIIVRCKDGAEVKLP